jgi:hydroxyethylthiazole kinase
MLFTRNNFIGGFIMDNWFQQRSKDIVQRVRDKRPLVHHITNYVTVNDCANIVLAIGAAPVMADDIGEVADIVGISSALVLNIGTLNQRTIASMLAAGKAANQTGIPVVLDPVGAGATLLRTETAARIMDEVKLAVIRGNISEIKAVSGAGGKTRGVDASEGDAAGENDIQAVNRLAINFAKRTGSVVAITGVIDVVSDGARSCFIKNGHAVMADITGTGCMCTALTGAFVGAEQDYTAATVAAVMAMGIAGEKAYRSIQAAGLGNGSYRTFMIDEISRMNDETLTNEGKISFESTL